MNYGKAHLFRDRARAVGPAVVDRRAILGVVGLNPATGVFQRVYCIFFSWKSRGEYRIGGPYAQRFAQVLGGLCFAGILLEGTNLYITEIADRPGDECVVNSKVSGHFPKGGAQW